MSEQTLALVENYQSTLDGIDAQFEFWLTLTFAVVVASFLAHNQISSRLRWAVASLYLLTVVLVALRTAHHMEVARFIAELILAAEDGPPLSMGRVIWYFRPLIFVLGTIAAVVFVLFPSLARASPDVSDSKVKDSASG